MAGFWLELVGVAGADRLRRRPGDPGARADPALRPATNPPTDGKSAEDVQRRSGELRAAEELSGLQARSRRASGSRS